MAVQNSPTSANALDLAANTRQFCSRRLSIMHCLVSMITLQQSLLMSAIYTALILIASNILYISTTSKIYLLISAQVFSPLLIIQLILLWLQRQFLIYLHLVDWILWKEYSQHRWESTQLPVLAELSPSLAFAIIQVRNYWSSYQPVLSGSTVIALIQTSIMRLEFTGMPGRDLLPYASEASMQNLPLKLYRQRLRQNSKPGSRRFLPKVYVTLSCLILTILSRQTNCFNLMNSPTLGVGPVPGSTITIFNLCGMSSIHMPCYSSFCQKIGLRGYGLQYQSVILCLFLIYYKLLVR